MTKVTIAEEIAERIRSSGSLFELEIVESNTIIEASVEQTSS